MLKETNWPVYDIAMATEIKNIWTAISLIQAFHVWYNRWIVRLQQPLAFRWSRSLHSIGSIQLHKCDNDIQQSDICSAKAQRTLVYTFILGPMQQKKKSKLTNCWRMIELLQSLYFHLEVRGNSHLALITSFELAWFWMWSRMLLTRNGSDLYAWDLEMLVFSSISGHMFPMSSFLEGVVCDGAARTKDTRDVYAVLWVVTKYQVYANALDQCICHGEHKNSSNSCTTKVCICHPFHLHMHLSSKIWGIRMCTHPSMQQDIKE